MTLLSVSRSKSVVKHEAYITNALEVNNKSFSNVLKHYSRMYLNIIMSLCDLQSKLH